MYKVSVIMGIYNCEQTLKESIESILNQSYQDFELIMCDDGSKDNTYEIAKQYEDKYPQKIILLKNKTNKGLNYTLNKCLKNANGEYIARQDGDDISLPERFMEEVEFLDKNPQYAIVSCPMIYFDKTGDWGKGTAIEKPEIKDFVLHTPFFCHAPCMMRKNALIEVGGYTVDKKLLRYEDCNLWYKMYSKGYRGYNLNKHLYKMRDDRDAMKRRTVSSRMRAVYVQYTGFRLVKIPIIYYLYLPVVFIKSLILAFMPRKFYQIIHKIRWGK